MTNVRVRFAPSPTGALHIGGIRTALFDWLYAKHTGGTFILRIEDTDKARETEDGVQVILDSLRQYGLDYDEGPEKGGPFAPYVQSERLDIYHKHIERLIADGKAYRAYDLPEELARMRENQQRRGLPPGYDRRHRYITDAERAEYETTRGSHATVRFAVPLEGEVTFTDAVYGEITVQNRILEDAILLKSDGFPTYHLAAQVDDHLMEISHVLRGEEWLPSAPLHILIHRALGWEPPIYAHLPVMMGPDKKKFGKRNGALGALEYPKQGYLQDATINFLAMQGWSPKEERDLFSVPELVEKFDLDGILNRSPISDPEKLLWFNGQYLRKLSLPELAAQTLPFLQDAGLVGENPDAETLGYIGRVLALEQERMKTLAEGPLLADFFLLGDDEYLFDDKAAQKWLNHPGVADRLRRVRDGFAALEVFDEPAAEEVVRATIAEFDVKGGDVIHPVRVAISGRTNGPGLFDAIAVLGRERCINRLNRALGMVGETKATE